MRMANKIDTIKFLTDGNKALRLENEKLEKQKDILLKCVLVSLRAFRTILEFNLMPNDRYARDTQKQIDLLEEALVQIGQVSVEEEE
jgi:hypothetical protein